MSHRQVLQALSGLLLGMFVAVLSSTIVTTSLPTIVADLGGSQSSYPWVMTATLLTLTVSTPIWGKLADLFDRKRLVVIGLCVYVAGSMLAGLSESMGQLIACRAVQGIGVGGLTALVHVILSDLVSPRERGRYAGYLGAVWGVGTVAGPLLGGLVTDAFGWRWSFYIGVPFGMLALVLLHRTLHLPRRARRPVSLDYAGAALVAVGASSLMIWLSLPERPPVLVLLGAVALVAFLHVERRATQPLIPLHLFGDRTVVLSVVASAAVGIVMFATTLFIAQYMQVARGYSATASGLLTIPMVLGMFAASTVVGRLVTRTGAYKGYMLAGAASLTGGTALMGLMDETTSLVELGVFMLMIGTGLGMLMQNLLLAVQNVVRPQDMGAGSALVAFWRSMGGAVGISVLGAVLAAKTAGAADVQHAYGEGIGEVFLLAAPLGLVAFVAIALIRERPLGTRSGIELAAEAAPA